MAQDAAASGATSDADSTTTGDQNSDAGTTGDQQPPNIDKIVAARVGQALRKYNLDELQKKAAAYDSLEESQKSEQQKLTERIQALESEKSNWESERRRDRLESVAVREAAKLGFRDPDDALAHVARRLDSVEFDKDGKPTNVANLLSDMLKDKPYLAGVQGSADGGNRGDSGEGKTPTMNELLRAAAGQ